MSPPTASPPDNIKPNCSAVEVIWYLYKFIHGSPLPGNVLDEYNPHHLKPENLPGGVWFFIYSVVDRDNKDGFWKTKGEPCKIDSDSMTIGWITTLEFYEGQAPHERKTKWVMQEYRISQGGWCEGSNVKETGSLCKVFLDGEQSQNHGNQLNLGSTVTASVNHIDPTRSIVPNADNSIGQSSRSQPQGIEDEDDDILMWALTESSRDYQHQNLPGVDHPPQDDFMELLDLENQVSSPSSSESSCVTISSDECFDSLALLQDLEPENNQKDADCKFSVSAPVKPNEVVVLPVTSGPLISDKEKMLTPSDILKTDNDILKNASGNRKPNIRNEGSSTNSLNVMPPFNSHIVAADGENNVGRKKNFWKYLCFWSF
ncbi:nac domain-containing protein 72 [Fagus crenata]